MFLHLGLFLMSLHFIYAQLPSPCPQVFKYEPREQDDRWYGVITLQTPEELIGVWVRIVLDTPAELLGNWFGEATSPDNQQFTIRNKDYRLEEGPPVLLRFFVKYNQAKVIPSLQEIRLNGRLICGQKQNLTRPANTLHISKPNRPDSNGGSSSSSNSNQQRPSKPDSDIVFTEESKTEREPQRGSTNSNRWPTSSTTTTTGASFNPTNINEGSSDEFFSGDFRPLVTPRPQSTTQVIKDSNAQCGTVVSQATPLITYGQSTTKGQFPWHVAIYRNEAIQITYICGGTLITTLHVLTAAHCVSATRSTKVIDPDLLMLYLGKYSLRANGAEVQERRVSSIYVHPDYNLVLHNDIALLRLERPAEFTNYVRPCCLWEGDDDLDLVTGQRGTVVGWGFNENNKISDQLLQTKMPIVSQLTCIYSKRDFYSRFLFENNFCAGFRNETMVCNGDSGGGMVFPKPGTSGTNSVWRIRGIVSVGVARVADETSATICDPKNYAVFTDVAKYLDWIQQTMLRAD